jgi:uncharacterized protein YuzE
MKMPSSTGDCKAMNGEPVVYDPETDTLLVELGPWPAASPAEVNEQVGGENVEEGLVVHYGPDGLPHAFEVEHASERPDLVTRALAAVRHARGFSA